MSEQIVDGVKIIEDIKKGPLHSAYAIAPFPEAKRSLETLGYRVVSMEEDVRLRIQEGTEAHVSKNGTWTRQDLIYIPRRGMFLTDNSITMQYAKEITQCFERGQEFILTDEQVKKALQNSIQLSIKYVQTDLLGKCGFTARAFGNLAEEYGKFLTEAAKKYGEFLSGKEPDIVPIPNAWGAMEHLNKPYVRPIWLRNVSHWSAIDADSRGLHHKCVVRGVKDA